MERIEFEGKLWEMNEIRQIEVGDVFLGERSWKPIRCNIAYKGDIRVILREVPAPEPAAPGAPILHVPTLTAVMIAIQNLGRKSDKSRYSEGIDEGIRECLRTVESMRLNALKGQNHE